MKKIILAAFCLAIFIGVTHVNAQELTQKRKASSFALSNPVQGSTAKRTAPPRQNRTVTFRYDDGVTSLSEAQKERLMQIAKRISENKTHTIQIVSASKNVGDAGDRVMAIESFLRSYEREFQYLVRYIVPENIVPSVNNTVKITERK